MKEILYGLLKKTFGETKKELCVPEGMYIGLYDHQGRFVYTEANTRRDQEVILEDLSRSNNTIEGAMYARDIRRTLVFEGKYEERKIR